MSKPQSVNKDAISPNRTTSEAKALHNLVDIEVDIVHQPVDIETPNINKTMNSVDMLSDDNLNYAARESIKAQEEMHEKALEQAYKRGYIDGGLDEILRHEKASKEVIDHLSKNGHTHDWATDDFHMRYCSSCGQDDTEYNRQRALDD
jgi:phosphoenolpyruvate-protein kinase (PTS system EI component)